MSYTGGLCSTDSAIATGLSLMVCLSWVRAHDLPCGKPVNALTNSTIPSIGSAKNYWCIPSVEKVYRPIYLQGAGHDEVWCIGF